ncbi:hypothetical protein PENANT_c015G11526 [Penicillium antarcticum]|uniref:Uncharacterized protein n=1 Tax=Penicillium antarcticum TaxID=416450 RepID=A0A1V6Q366_9EURO|nr:uncharacterized protein N7508_004833 [Penicillium antarcticum]KAJ5305818.1 hypothetical protein N7508_004833 [Penicillium antarcticum]OQD83720.1 hypothetical protein PENANT_c015G11526 [Penicillium antarcticum]
MPRKWAETTVRLPSIPPLKAALLNDDLIDPYKVTSKAKKDQAPNPHPTTSANTAKFITESNVLEPERPVGSKSTSAPRTPQVVRSYTDMPLAFRPRNRRVGQLPALRPHQVITREPSSKWDIGLKAPQWGYTVARAA